MFNLSSPAPPDQELSPSSPAVVVILAIYFAVFTAVGTVGNLLVVIGIAFSPKLWTSSNFYILNVCVTDFLFCSLSGPFHVLVGLGVLDQVVCVVMATITSLIMCTSFFSLAAVALNRYLIIKLSPDKYRKLYSWKRISLSIVILWILSLLCTVPSIVIGQGQLDYGNHTKICIILGDDNEQHNHIHRFVLSLVMGIPISLVIFFSYYGIWRIFRNSVQNMQNQDALKRDTYRLTRNLFVVTILFSVCWLPGVVLFIVDFHYNFPVEVYQVVSLLAYSHSFINPIIYAALNRSLTSVYRNTVKTLRNSCRRTKPRKDSDMSQQNHSKKNMNLNIPATVQTSENVVKSVVD